MSAEYKVIHSFVHSSTHLFHQQVSGVVRMGQISKQQNCDEC